jgi:hypothetical protein
VNRELFNTFITVVIVIEDKTTYSLFA